METINDRMEVLVNQMFGGNKAAFAKELDMAPTSMSSYLGAKRRSKPSVDMVAKIITKLNVDARWLITGEPGNVENSVETKGDFSPASLNGDVNVGADAVLAEKVKHLEALVAEKERLIQVLLEGRK
jgi:transcriptional regulator with XRE-family HTH domain